MQAVILIGIQGAGKSQFCKQQFFKTHMRLNLDMLKTRNREMILLEACLQAKQPFVVDNTNPTKADRDRYISKAKQAGFQIVGYYFSSCPDECLKRNDTRADIEKVPTAAVLGTYKKLELPSRNEGFDELYYVRISETGKYIIEEFFDEI